MLTTPRRNEDVATDTLYSRTPAIDDGSTAAQFYVGRASHFRSVMPLGSSDKQMARTLMDEIRKYGAMNRLVSDNARAQISARVKEILRTFCIDDWQSEPYKGNQNFAERAWKDSKTRTNNLLNMSGAPPELWLQALMYVCYIQNHTAVPSLGNRTPTEWLLGYTPDSRHHRTTTVSVLGTSILRQVRRQVPSRYYGSSREIRGNHRKCGQRDDIQDPYCRRKDNSSVSGEVSSIQRGLHQ